MEFLKKLFGKKEEETGQQPTAEQPEQPAAEQPPVEPTEQPEEETQQ